MTDVERAYERHLRGQERESPDQILEGYRVWFDAALPSQRTRALDYGSGRGHGLDYLRACGFSEVEAYEPNQVLASALESKASRVHTGDPGLLHSQPRFDFILLKDVLEHVPKPTAIPLLTQLLSALLPSGRLVVSVPHAVSFTGVYTRYADFTHVTAFTEPSLRYVLESAGGSRVTFHPPRFRFRLSPKTIAYRALKRAWFTALKGIYYLENPSADALPPHFHPRLVASASPNPR